MSRFRSRVATASALLLAFVTASLSPAFASGGDVRLTNDVSGGYISAYTLATGNAYADSVIQECAVSRGRQNEPAVEIDPRNPKVLIGSSNDYCGVYATKDAKGNPFPGGPIWLGYYRSEDGGASFRSSLVPGYPGDTSPYATLAMIRTASSGDPVIAWDGHGRVFMGSEASGDPAGTAKTFGDEWVATFDNPGGEQGNSLKDGLRFVGSVVVAKGSSAPNLLGKFNDKTAIETDRTGGTCDGTVYFAWSRFSGNAGDVAIYFSLSADHGATWSSPDKLTPSIHDVQFPDIAVTSDGSVYVAFRQFAAQGGQQDAIMLAKSTDCGRTFAPPQQLATFTPYDAQDVTAPQAAPVGAVDDPLFTDSAPAAGATARDCGDFALHCQSGYTFFRIDTQVRATADQADKQHQAVYLVFDATKPGTVVSSGTTFGTAGAGNGSQSGIFFLRYDGASGTSSTPALIDNQGKGDQLFPDVAAGGGVLHALWWDSRNDPNYSPARPVGNDANGVTGPALDVFAASSNDLGATWGSEAQLSKVTSNPNFEQFANRTIPFAGDYLWISSVGGTTFGVWTDWRDAVSGADPREAGVEDNDAADVKQCRTFNSATSTFSGDTCPHDGGLDQNIYGAVAP